MIITWDNISEVNRRIKERDLAYKVHLSDACGGQSMWIESMDKANHFDNLDDLNDLIKNKHFNRYLQNSVNKYGIQNFKFEVLDF